MSTGQIWLTNTLGGYMWSPSLLRAARGGAAAGEVAREGCARGTALSGVAKLVTHCATATAMRGSEMHTSAAIDVPE